MLKVKSQILKYIAFAAGGMILGGIIALFQFSFYASKVSGSSCPVSSNAPNLSAIK